MAADAGESRVVSIKQASQHMRICCPPAWGGPVPYGLPTVCSTVCLCMLSSTGDGPAAAMQVVSFTGALGTNIIVYKGYDVEADMQLLQHRPAVR